MALSDRIADLAGAVRDKLNLMMPRISDVETEIAQARGGRTELGLRLDTISNFASPNAGGIIAGQYYDNAFQALSSTVLAGVAGRVEMAPFYTSQPLTIDQIGVSVSTAVTGALARCFIYGSDAAGWPGALAWEAGDDLNCATTGFKGHSLAFSFDSGRQYWLGVHHSSTAAIRAINLGSAVNLGINGSGGTTYFSVLRRTIAFSTPMPEAWGFVAADRAAGIPPPSIRMRAA